MRRLDWNNLKRKFHEIKTVGVPLLCLTMFATENSFLTANPQNPTVISGSATFHSPSPSTLQINTNNNTIINWDSFSIDAGELTSFLQPNSSAAVLNRVTGNNLSNILGTLQANGSIFLINPNGILIGNGAVINTGSFLASTLDIADSDFLANGDLPFIGSTKNGVVNLGSIQSTAGDIILLGYNVENHGTLNSNEGSARLFAGTQLLLQVNGPERIVIQPQVTDSPKDGTGVYNSGTINAVVAELKADGNPYLLGINHEGQINATGIVSENGKVYLRADNGLTCVSGSITSSNYDGIGGNITVLGDQIAVLNQSLIDASGDFGGGTILIGGGYQGKDESVPNANKVVIKTDVKVIADANITGDGGTIIQWSDDQMFYYGQSSARGGENSGNGGFIETSGKQYLDYQGSADLFAPNGTRGTLFLDPSNLTISTNSSTNIAPAVVYPIPVATPPPNPPDYWDFFPKPINTNNSNLNITDLTNALGTADVYIQTGNDNGVGSGDISWTGFAIPPSNPGNLTLDSVNNIIFWGINTVNGTGLVTNDSLSINFIAQNDILFQGATTFNPSLTTVIIFNNGTTNLKAINGDIKFLAGSSPSSNISLQSTYLNIDAPNGSVIMKGGSSSTAGVIGNPVFVTANNQLSINAGKDLSLIAGTGADSGVQVQGTSQLNLNIGGNCSLIAQNGSTVNSPSNVTLFGNNIDATIGQDLILQGGSNTDNSTSFYATDRTFNINIGNDLQMTSGTASGTFAQIGSPTGGTSDINISKIGGNAVLNANTSASNAYCMIGHLQSGFIGAPPGNIVVNGTPSSSLTLNGGATGGATFSTYAKIGHKTDPDFPSLLKGDITVSNFGGTITLNPNQSSASIGHGTTLITAPNITGNINLYNNTGNINLLGGTNTRTYSQIGHINSTNIAGDITVNTTGNINLAAGNFTDSKAIIGHGGFWSPNNANYEGNILVTSDNLTLTAGNNNLNCNAVIGFEPGGDYGTNFFSCSIDPASTIRVSTLHNITLQAGTGPSFPSSNGGNAIIGHGAYNNANGLSFINDISVESTLGNIRIYGGTSGSLSSPTFWSGRSLIGTDAPPVVNNFPTSNVSVSANNGTLYLYGNVPNTTQKNGVASILNSAAKQANVSLNISAGDIYLFGAQGGLPSFGNLSFIVSGEDLNVTTTRDLQLTGITGFTNIYALGGTSSYNIGQDLIVGGSSNIGGAQIGHNANSPSPAPLSTTFSIGHDLKLLGGTTGGAKAQIGYSLPSNQSDITFTQIGGNIVLQAGSGTFSQALIGHFNNQDRSDTSTSGNILFESIGNNVTGANFELIGGSSQGSSAQIGHTAAAQNLPITNNAIIGDVRIQQSNAAVTLTGGSDQGCYAMIGHGGQDAQFQSCSFTGDVVVNAESVTLTGGSGILSDAIIGFASSSDISIPSTATTITSTLVQVNSNGPVTLTAGNDSNAVIGYCNPNSIDDNINIDNINITANGGNLTLNAGIRSTNSGGNAIAGIYTSLGTAQSSIKITTPFDVIVQGTGQNNGLAWILNTYRNTGNDTRTVRIDPSRIIVVSGNGISKIISSGNLELNFSDALYLNYDPTNPVLQAQSAFISAAGDILINTSKPSYGNINVLGTNSVFNSDTSITATGDIQIGTPTQVGAGNITLGRPDIVSSTSLFSINGDVLINMAGNLELLGGNPGVSAIDGRNISITAAGDILLIDNGSSTFISSSGSGDVNITTGNDFSGFSNGRVSALFGGNLTINAARDITLLNNFLINSANKSNMNITAGRNILMDNDSNILFNSSGNLQISAGDITLNTSSRIDVSGTGELFLIADRHMYLNDNSTVSTNGGNLQLVVDNNNPDPVFYGRGKLIKGSAATVNTNGGAASIFTSRQSFNSISGSINGVPFNPGLQYLNTPLEQWGDYFETAFNGSPYTVFYKDNGTPIFPPTPLPPPHIPKKPVQELKIALSEALQEWRTMDELNLAPVQFCRYHYFVTDIRGAGCEHQDVQILYTDIFKVLRRDMVTYNTKRLLEILN